MKRGIVLVFLVSILFACNKNEKINLKFLDEYILTDSLKLKNTIIGGLSGVDFVDNTFFFVVDDIKNPRILSANILISENKITNISFTDVVSIDLESSFFLKESTLDLESILVDSLSKDVILVSEGSIKNQKKPSVFKIDKNGKFLENFELPENLTKFENIKNNASFEATSKSVDKKGFWVAMESPLKNDGFEPDFTKKSSPIRISYFDHKSKSITKQFAYQLEHIIKPSIGNINLNGVTAILEHKKNHFFIVERTYQNEFGAYGNSVKIFEAIINDTSSDILKIKSLKKSDFTLLEKRLIFDFNSIKEKLTNSIIDNIEGITFGPKLLNGNQSLLLVSDDNFQVYGKQLNQFILLEIEKNK